MRFFSVFLISFAFAKGLNDEIRKQFMEMVMTHENPATEIIEKLTTEVDIIETKLQSKYDSAFLEEIGFEEEDGVDTCQLCTAIRLTPRCRKPIYPGQPTRPRICRACLIYLVAGCLAN
ncbi:Oidioi.mRNA.OKI2018_I69.chr2.g8038.t1.cds [Oikopleura dioica]|uniref:Oidioi.mRNA.OKI2018_I69.chr2.g8038.t1.cds n=1 Tax=Oikopleura dioica TaxID=34765 RepID=A0ABN7T917_OIKDI|nr:Oidioi.mRNA.OKI2018_I69.chr2.g8038.t1.cds [Oikopleura dioica]